VLGVAFAKSLVMTTLPHLVMLYPALEMSPGGKLENPATVVHIASQPAN
jgi:hypothetical protein